MPWRSWLPRWRARRITVAGLDISAQACSLVVLTGMPDQPDAVCRAERLNLPEAALAKGAGWPSGEIVAWLGECLASGDTAPAAFYLGLDEALIEVHRVSLPTGLSEEDVAFQLQAEVLSRPEHATAECYIDYTLDATAAKAAEQDYVVKVVARAQVQAWLDVIATTGSCVRSVESCQAAVQRAQQNLATTHLPAVSAALAWQHSQAYGLALRAWHEGGGNFLPSAPARELTLRRNWRLSVASYVLGGIAMAAGLAGAGTWVGAHSTPAAEDVQAAAKAHEEAKKAHALATAQHQRVIEQTRWLQARRGLQAQSGRWSQVLSQAGQGLWLAHIKQQGTHFMVQGEALSASHAKQLLRQLKALDIWKQAPELLGLQVVPAGASTGWSVWQFRIEAHLKEGA